MRCNLCSVRLNTILQEFNCLAKSFPQSVRPTGKGEWAWCLDELSDTPGAEVERYGYASAFLPGHFSARFGNKILAIGHVLPWKIFLMNNERRQALRVAFSILAKAVDSDRIIWVPDSQFSTAESLDWVTDEVQLDFSSLERRLNEKFGPQPTEVESLYKDRPDGTWTGDGYFIENIELEERS